MKKIILLILFLLLFSSQEIFAQGNLKTGNSQIVADVDAQRGFVTVLLPGGNIGLDAQLCFQNKCFFSCKIGSTIFTNNDIVTLPANGKILNGATTTKIVDTIRSIWLDKNGCDIIQDIYPVEFSKSGQIVYKWKINNHSGAAVSVPSQYLQDMQITDPTASQPSSNDGPKILTKWQYTGNWAQYPNSTFPSLPWFYIGFLRNLPSAPSYNPGLSAMGYLDYGAPLFLIKPLRMTNGDWYDMTQYIFGSNPQWKTDGIHSVGTDNAVLLEFSSVSIPSGKTIEIARTSYGTGEYERCIGQLFSLVFYPHHVVWTKDVPTPPGSYTPNPIHIEKFVVVPGPPENNNASANTKITLTVGSHLTLSDNLCKTFYGKSQAMPVSGPGIFIAPGGVAYYDWWACADPAYFCTGPVIDTMKFTGSCGICPPAFLNDQGADQCDQTILIDCAEADIDAPLFSDTLVVHDSASINVRDWRTTDGGLKRITWTASLGTDSTKFVISGPMPVVKPCYTDKINHVITIIQKDSTIGGCFDFTFEDCLGHQSFHTLCFQPKAIARPDSLPPVFTFIKHASSRDSCRSLIDSFEVTDNRLNDSGICTLDIIPSSAINMRFDKTQFIQGDGIARFKVSVIDSLFDGYICIRATDCSKEAHFTDTCFRYCAVQNVSVAGQRSDQLSLEANHPNPFSHTTTFSYTIGEYGMVKLYLYDELGKEMSRIIEKPQAEGKYTISFDGSKLSSGSYIVRLESGGKVLSRKVTVTK